MYGPFIVSAPRVKQGCVNQCGTRCALGEFLAGFALFRAVLHIFPIASPLLAPLKGQIASQTDLGFEAVFCFCFHAVKITGVVAK